MAVAKRAAALVLGLCLALPGAAQEPPDTAVVLMPFRTADDTTGALRAPLSFAFDITRTLEGYGPSFTYDFGAFGWPAGWSPGTVSPQQVELRLGGVQFNDLITGRPRYDLLPTALLRNPKVDGLFGFASVAANVELRDLTADGPLTELHYQAGDNGLQRVTAIHSQTLNVLRPDRGGLQVMFAYAGAAVKGEYPGSRLRRKRQTLLQLRMQLRRVSLELAYLHNQRRLGAHSGVSGSSSVRYNRLIATVRNPRALRRDVRHDVTATARTRIIPGTRESLVAIVSISRQTLRFTNAQSMLIEAVARRGAVNLYQDWQIGAHRMRLALEGWVNAASSDSSRIHGPRRSEWRLSLVDEIRIGRLELMGKAGLHAQASSWSSRSAARLRFAWTQGFVSVSAAYAGAVEARVLQDGWSDYIAQAGLVPGSLSHIRARIQQSVGPWDISPIAFLQSESSVQDYTEVTPDTLAIGVGDGVSAGLGLHVQFRKHARRGFYAEAASWIMRSNYDIAQRDTALPKWAARAKAGLKYRMFTGDLVLNVSVAGRWWGKMRSRTLHAPTGLLVLPFYDRPDVSPSGSLDLVAEGQVRTATLFVAYDNILSGTTITPGIELVPGYPLPAQQFRFGVYWPIIN